ncbi:triphosphoribosyl-dephospho-CoA synthase [Paraburkholderia fungorum]|uniref:Triphosphoribosyl-dephospho-CoA synthase n=1 Tax=Paraburkholderia fungorum TaxID=134537 RepID=A0A1H1JCV9_9BURK|nr:triphosphoribosyl-dephospho-CoA synthase [Paraburkholderia fungorum]SDR47761.1 triphosphoribosyl-dephospho-CoA synthase [Paraburkholderia fungorum]
MRDSAALPSAVVRAAFVDACTLDVVTPKPGNVSMQSPGHGMRAEQFLASAEASADALFVPGAPVGQRILDAVSRTRDTVGCNTNLGIVLLVAPLAAALEHCVAPLSVPTWRASAEHVLAALDLDDARLAYRAIALANPGGLGDAPEQPVQAAPSVGLRDAMRLASERDSIARQYANGFADIFETGLTAYLTERARHEPDVRHAAEAAMLSVFLAVLARWPDSHIVRKHGEALAQSVTLAAREHEARWRDAPHRAGSALATAQLDAWDADLKRRAINPGTSADLAVATLFVAGCIERAGNDESHRRA